MKFDVFEYTNQGGRDYNEDSVGHLIDGENAIFVVADGLGGHQFGEVASACVCDTIVDGSLLIGGRSSEAMLENKIILANQKVLEIQNERNATLKSTVVALLVNQGKAVWANVGDSRLYYIHNNEIADVTNDHSVAFKKYKAGEISRDDIRTDEDQSCLLRSIGNTERYEPEMYCPANGFVCPGDAFMLCSDGVWEYLLDGEILIDYFKAENAKHWAELLLTRLMDRINGENDNLTIQTVIIE